MVSTPSRSRAATRISQPRMAGPTSGRLAVAGRLDLIRTFLFIIKNQKPTSLVSGPWVCFGNSSLPTKSSPGRRRYRRQYYNNPAQGQVNPFHAPAKLIGQPPPVKRDYGGITANPVAG